MRPIPTRSKSAVKRLVFMAVALVIGGWLFSPYLGQNAGSAREGGSQARPAFAASNAQAAPPAIEGWVTDEASGQPVEGVVVEIAGGAQVTSGEDGYFSVAAESLPELSNQSGPTRVDVTASAADHAAWTIRQAVYYPGDTLRLYPKLPAAGSPAKLSNAAVTRFGLGRFSTSKQSTESSESSGTPVEFEAMAANPTLPASIRVYRTATGEVEVVPFKDYVKHVLPNEWIPTWPAASLRAGAMAVKEYGWYWVSRGGKQVALGADVKDNTDDQVYDPNVSYASTDSAVDATWQHAMLRGGALFQAQYCAGSYQADPTGDCPWPGPYMTQWGSAYYGDQGQTWDWIIGFYYQGVTISPAPAGGGAPLPPSQPVQPPPTKAPVAAVFTVGQGSERADLFQAAYDRNGGAAALGRPVGPVKWWLPYVSEVNVVAQQYSGTQANGGAWIVYDVLKSAPAAYAMTGQIAQAYASHQPQGPEWLGAPTSDPYIARDGSQAQGFTKGALSATGSGVQATGWSATYAGWKAEYFPGTPPLWQFGPSRDWATQPALVLDAPAPDMNWDAALKMPAALGAGTGAWYAQFTRSVQPAAGSYDITLAADSGATLWVDELLAVNAWSATAPHSNSYNVDFDGGPHTLRIQYQSPTSTARLAFGIVRRDAAQQAGTQAGTGASGAASLRVKVVWLGRAQAPGDAWVQPLTLQLSAPGNPAIVGTYSGKTDRNGVAIYNGLPTGTYDVHVKGLHSIQTARAGVLLAANRTVDVDMKAQVEGDIDGDNCVTVADFERVQRMVGTHKDMQGFDPAADLNGDGLVTISDVSLLRSGFDMCGDLSGDTQLFALSSENAPSLSQALSPWLNPEAQQRNLALSVAVSSRSVKVGQVVQAWVVADAGTQPIDGGQFILNYDPAKLQPSDANGAPADAVVPGVALPAVLGNWVDAKGGIGYSAAMLQGVPPQGKVVLGSIYFKAMAAGQAQLSFAGLPSPWMTLTNGGTNLLSRADGVTITVVP